MRIITPILDVLVFALISVWTAFFISICDIKLRMDQIAVGFVLTILCIHLSNYLGQDYVRINGPLVTKFSIPINS